MPNKIKVQAKDVSEAIAKGLKELGLRRDQVEVTVLETPKKGFLGIGSRPAVVELRQKRWSTANLDAQIYMDVPKKRPSKSRNGRNNRKEAHGNRRNNRRSERVLDVREPREKAPKANEPQMLPCEAIRNAVIPENLKAPMAEAKEYLEKVLTHMGIKVENLNVWWDDKQQRILLTFDCDHPAIVIGKEGKTLEAIQYLCTLALSRHFDKPISVITDTQNYWRKAEDKINAEIEKGIDMIKRGNSVFRFRPMSAQLRRYIHRAVEGNEFVTTASEGEGKWRKVTLRPTEKALEASRANTAPADFVPGVIGEDIPEEAKTETVQEEVVVTVDNGAEKETCAVEVVEECPCCHHEEEAHEACSCCEGEHDSCACESSAKAEEPAQAQAPAAENKPEAAPADHAEKAATEEKKDSCGGCCGSCNCGPLFETPADKPAETK